MIALTLALALQDPRVLFLGDRGHHQPAERAKQIAPVLAGRGIALTYSENPDDLLKLATYHAVLLYANIDAITPAQEAALLDFVAGGGGFVPVHCASYCFRNSEKVVALMGAQFKSHGTGTFRATIVKPEHPAMRGVEAFESWDETYVHHKHNETDRVVLATRDGEPWTWVRTHGRGRVFYTAWGHDQRTWSNPGFQTQLEAGIRWAAKQDPSPFEYQEADVPFYAGSHKPGENLKKMQKPCPPELSASRLRVPDGFEARLFAHEPAITKPIALAFDEKGRLWLSESMDYPNELGTKRDRLKICEDTDGDGRADKFTVFADGLSIPTSLCFANGGVIVAQAPDTLFLKDTDGDGKADERRVLFSGWGAGDTHAGPSNLRWGFDNWVWGIVGYSGFNGTVGGKAHRFSMGFFRFKPDGSALEFIRSTNNNSWGLGFSEDGVVFGSTANGNPSEYMPIANRYYEAVSGWSASRLGGIAGNPEFHPVTDKVRQVDFHHRFTAAAGHALYTARLFPPEYWNRTAFVCEPTGHLGAVFELRPKGADFSSRVVRNLCASDDEWTAPIAAEVGPDGAVWVLDWYNYIVQHNPTPPGFKNGKGNAYEIGLRDKTHGRVYRIFPKGAAFPAPPADPLAMLTSDNLLWRLHGQRLLVERGAEKAPLEKLVRGGSIHALRVLDTLGLLEPAVVVDALRHPSAGLRRNALQVAKDVPLSLLADPDAQVRLAALLALSEREPSKEAGEAVFDFLQKPENAEDKWLPDAATAAAARHDAGFLGAALGAMKGGAAPAAKNLLGAQGWRPVTYGGTAELTRDGAAFKIRSEKGADASWSFTLPVTAGARYRLSAKVKTNGLAKDTGRGAQLNVHEIQPQGVTGAISGTTDWTRLEVEFEATVPSITVNCLLGGWGRSRGEAWWDDVQLVALSGRAPQGKLGGIVTAVTRHYARRGDAATAPALLARLPGADPALADFLLQGLAAGWPKGKPIELSAALKAELSKLPIEAQAHLVALGLLDASGVAAASTSALGDPKRPAEERIEAARRLVRVDDRQASIAAVLAGVTPREAAAGGFIDALGESRLPETGGLLLEKWSDLTPAVRRRAIVVLLRQPAWTAALLGAIEAGTLGKTDVAAEYWSQLRNHPDAALAARAAKIADAGGGAVSADREALWKKLLPAAEAKGDVARGKALFAQLCVKCHAIDGAGGKVAPDLTGIGARPRRDILLEIVDPNRSVEANFRMWQVRLKDGQILAGRLDTETATSVELLDVEGKSHVLQRDAIDAMKPSALSIMPVGLIDAVPEGDVAALLEYLAASKKK
ncbi:MAG TPA: PVC-type heme-binding CxxCH protein [Planctomycetota bacterium]